MICVIGSNGFVGKNFCKFLIKKKKNFIGLTRKIIHKKNNQNYVRVDLINLNKVEKILIKYKPDTIVNLAAKVNFKKKKYHRCKINFELPKFLADFSKKNKTNLIQMSGTIVHGQKFNFYTAKTPLKPENNYGKNKLKADKYIINKKIKYVIIRTGGIYGKDGPFHLGINKTISEAIKKKIPKLYGNGEFYRNYIYVNDLCRFLYFAINKKKRGVFYISGEKIKLKKMIKQISSKFTKNNYKQIKYKGTNKDQIVKKNISYKNISFKKSLDEIAKL